MSGFEVVEGRDLLPRRIFLEGDQTALPDPLDGFIRPVGKILPVGDLLACSAALVVAPPWTGKTFVSRQIENALTSERRLCERTGFEAADAPGRNEDLLPGWWPSWQDSGDQAWWLVDALDEDERREDRRAREILCRVSSLPPSARARLHLILFCRLNEIPSWCDGLPDLRRVRLAGADRETARTIVGSERFDRVCELIRRNGLQSLAPFPAVLEHLRGRVAEETLTEESIWQGVLTDLLQDRRRDPLLSPFEPERFEVAQRLAAISTFCGEQVLRLNLHGMETLLSPGALHLGDLRLAAREVLKKTAVFERVENGFRFAQDHVRQWLAAFALQDMPLSRVKPLLTLDSGEPDPRHEGIMSFLARISRHSEVQTWIIEAHEGLPDPDLVPWSLKGAIQALDVLQEKARLSPWGLRLWGEERLQSFLVAGMGEEIARRLERDLRPAEQQLLFHVAVAIEALEALPATMRLLQDLAQDAQVRAQAADFVARFGGSEELGLLAEWVEARIAENSGSDEALATLVAAFYEKGLWSFEQTAEIALARPGLESGWLQFRLAQDLTLDRARRLLRHRVAPVAEARLQPLIERALKKIQKQESPGEADSEVLIPLILRGDFFEPALHGYGWQIIRFLEKDPAARRSLFLQGLALDPQRQGENTWTWANCLEGEDAEWLLALILGREDQPGWLWQLLYFLAERQGNPRVLEQVRREIQARVPELLAHLEKEWDEWRQTERRWREASRSESRSVQDLEPLVRNTLLSPETPPRDQAFRLSWYCFEEPTHRPTDVRGRWEDLPDDLRHEVLALCRRALLETEPTSIPEGSSYPLRIHWEAACFDHLVRKDEAFPLTSDMIRKWLPALLRAWDSSSKYEETLRQCFAVDRHLSEDVFFATFQRALRSESGRIYIIQELPADLWSERFASMLEEIILGEAAQIEARVDLFRRLQRIFPDRACSMARSWVRSDLPLLRDTGIDALLLLDPEEGWSFVKGLIGQEGPLSVFRRMPSLHDLPYGLRIDFASWPAVRLVELEKLLIQSLPPENDPKLAVGEGRALDVDDDLRSLRGKLPRLLHSRRGDGDQEALDQLAYDHPEIREELTQTLMDEGVEGALARSGRERPRPSSPDRLVPLEDMVRLLRDVRFRLLRTTDDLLNVVVEEIRQIQIYAQQHLSMLYLPQPREKGQKRKHLQEDALQTYIACRLADRLPYVLGEKNLTIEPISIDRETLAARNTRNDLKIQKASLAGTHLTVIIEIKWSDHRDVSTSLVHQLGEDYLLNNGLTHGIYLVGWSGPTRNWPDCKACQTELVGQAQRFCQSHPELRITPVVLDLSWSPAT